MTVEKVNQIIKNKLLSGDAEKAIQALNAIKQMGNKLYIPVLFDLLQSNPEKEVEKEVKKLLGTVKDKETIPGFIAAIKDDKYRSILKPLLIVCWQNGLDFSDYWPVFVDLIIKEEWEIAFEAFTVIDNLEILPDPKVVSETKAKIEIALVNAKEQNAYFLREILTKID